MDRKGKRMKDPLGGGGGTQYITILLRCTQISTQKFGYLENNS